MRETLALVGATGSGKTTLTTLPTRLYDRAQRVGGASRNLLENDTSSVISASLIGFVPLRIAESASGESG